MTQKKNTTLKKSNVARSNKVNTKYKFKPWHAMAGLALFIAGGFVVAYSQAATETAAFKKTQPLIHYEYSDAPTIVEKNNSTATLTQGPKTIQLTKDGDLYCFEKNTDAGNNRKLSAAEIRGLLNELKAAQPTQIAVSSETATISAQSITYLDPASNQPISIDLAGKNATSPGAIKVSAALEKACKTNPKPVKRKDAPSASVAKPKTTTFNINSIQRSLIGVAQAAEYQQYNDQFNITLLSLIQKARRDARLAEYIVTPCLNKSANEWSGVMANRWNQSVATFGVPPGDYKQWHSENLMGLVDKHCGVNWRGVAENVGWNPAAAKGINANQAALAMFTNYMNSTGHRAAILSTSYREVNVGSIMTQDKKAIFNTTHFLRR
ncbi:MAG: hypothetical protein QG658_601 [Patescibacteria group bacterium]|nr:hypothetical protein [Patescibacteria group bacterium]